MKIRRIALIIAVIVIFGISYSIMNFHYDRLSRYPYSNDDDRELILKYLNDDDINYIIEYSVEPSYFINYITYKDFSIYHADQYNKLKEIFPNLSNQEIVYYTELFNAEGLDFRTGCAYLTNYTKQELKYWFEHKDLYVPGSYLIEFPDSFLVNITKDTTISIHVPPNLIELDNGIKLRKEAYDSYSNMCQFINKEYNRTDCGGIIIENGYISYSEQKSIYDLNQNNNIPGHDYHQTGIVIDVNLDSSVFKDNVNQFAKICKKFNFFPDTCKNGYYHIRYIGQ